MEGSVSEGRYQQDRYQQDRYQRGRARLIRQEKWLVGKPTRVHLSVAPCNPPLSNSLNATNNLGARLRNNENYAHICSCEASKIW